MLLSPFGVSDSPLRDPSQLIVGTIEVSLAAAESWMRVSLYLTQNRRYYEFLFRTLHPDNDTESRHWYWIDSNPKGSIGNIYGPFPTTLRVPGQDFFADAQWGNSYPLMCTDRNKQGTQCDHWLFPPPGSPGHGSWYSFRRDTGNLFRILVLDSTNPSMLPILGSYFIANLPTFTDGVSDRAKSLIDAINRGRSKARRDYWNPMVTQEDIERAMAFPLASASCTAQDIAAVIPGFTAVKSVAGLPSWSDNTYAQGWSIGGDPVPYATRVCYLWTGDADNNCDADKQQCVFIGMGSFRSPLDRAYSTRADTCLNCGGTTQPYYEWDSAAGAWAHRACIPVESEGLPYPDWLARDGALIVGRIRGNPRFGLAADETLNLIAAQAPSGVGKLAIFWLWFLENGVGMLFSEGNYMNPLSHNLQAIDYNLFLRDAGLTQNDFSSPCGWAQKAGSSVARVHGYFTHIGGLRSLTIAP